jgi:hypothetical protein
MGSLHLFATAFAVLGVLICYQFKDYYLHWRQQTFIMKCILFTLLFHVTGAVFLAAFVWIRGISPAL